MSDTVTRIAAKGDGLTESGRHVAGAVPGDTVDADGTCSRCRIFRRRKPAAAPRFTRNAQAQRW